MSLFGLFSDKKDKNLQKEKSTDDNKPKEGFLSKISRAIAGKSEISDDLLDELEEALIGSDIGTKTTVQIIERLEERIAKQKYIQSKEVYDILKEVISKILLSGKSTENVSFSNYSKDHHPHVILVVGVNGVGKTTTIGKLANQFKIAGKKVLLGAADTFRAAATEQLTLWAERTGTDIIKQKMGADPGAVAFDTLQAATARGADIVMIDTAGRLHNKTNLMNELTKIKNVMSKVIPDAPHEVLLVLDASTGQNAIEQAKQFTEATKVTGIALTKLDGTAKGGVVIAIANMFNIPIRFIGIGEKIDDIKIFNNKEFAESLFE